jgi:hypothetical protein
MDDMIMNPNDERESALEQPTPPALQPVEMQPVVPSVSPGLPFKADFKDGIFAIFAFILGYIFSRWVLGATHGWGVAVFTAVFLASVSLYLLKKGVRFSAASWFWLIVTLLTGISFALWNENGLMPLRNLFLFCAAVYWVLCATNIQLAGKTGNYLILDVINGVLIVPFRNFINQYISLGVFRSGRVKTGKKGLSILLGVFIAIAVLFFVTPQLLAADSGGFHSLLKDVIEFFTFDTTKLLEFLVYCIPAIPVAAYMFGLVSGGAHKKGVKTFQAEKTDRAVSAVRIVAPATIYTVLGTVCVLYLIFIACQVPYFFSAFSRSRPEGWLSYSEFARQGFFELCRIAAINLVMLALANLLSKKPRSGSAALKAFNVVLALITLLLIATAMSKMALYIDVFGLSVLRILTTVFMAFLALISLAVIAMQKWRFSIARFALVAGTILFVGLCATDVDGIVVRYNTDRYLAGTLTDYDPAILYRSGPAGVLSAIQVYNETGDENVRREIRMYLVSERETIDLNRNHKNTYRHTWQSEQAWDALEDMMLE